MSYIILSSNRPNLITDEVWSRNSTTGRMWSGVLDESNNIITYNTFSDANLEKESLESADVFGNTSYKVTEI